MMSRLIFALCIFIVACVFALPPVPDHSKSCLECRTIVKGLDVVFGNASKVESFIEKVNEKCGSHKICRALADTIIKIPAGIFEGMDKEAWPDWGLCSLISECKAPCCNSLSKPEQVHLSLTENDATKMMVSWVTLEGTESHVEFGSEPHSLSQSVVGTVLTYTQGGFVGVIHRAVMTGLEPGKKYYYRVGGDPAANVLSKWSDTFAFNAIPPAGGKPLTFAVIADMSYDPLSDNTVNYMTKLVDEGKIDVVVHSGDISYADGFMPHFDNFMNKIQPIASRVPYMVAPGNHEFGWNFAAYKARFFMPGTADSMFYAWRAGGVAFVALSTETMIDTANMNKDNVEFAEKALSNVDRAQTPWVVAHFHRPLYCSSHDSCGKDATHLRKQVEDVFNKHAVDFTFSGHVHSYQRTTPVYQEAVKEGAPVYFMQGAAGNREGKEGPYPPADQLPAWIAHSEVEFGVGLFTLSADQRTIDWQYVDAATGAVLDSATYKH